MCTGIICSNFPAFVRALHIISSVVLMCEFPMSGDWSLESLLEPLLCITEDGSSVAARLAVSSLGTMLPQLLHSHHGNAAIQALIKLLQVKDNSYWLVKVSRYNVQLTLTYDSCDKELGLLPKVIYVLLCELIIENIFMYVTFILITYISTTGLAKNGFTFNKVAVVPVP